jgi:hypothetical protein
VGRSGALGEDLVGDDLKRDVMAPAEVLDLVTALPRPAGAYEDAENVLRAVPQRFTNRVVSVEDLPRHLTLP